MFKRFSKTCPALLLAGFVWHDASAASVLFTGAGTWDSDAPTTSFSAAGASWSFKFLLPDAIPINPTSAVSSFAYALNGSVVASAPASIEFFDSTDSGMFDIDFQNGQVVSLYGPIVWTAPSLKIGTYDVFTGLAGGQPVGSGTLSLQAVSPIPEPAAWATLALGLVAMTAVTALGAGRGRAGRKSSAQTLHAGGFFEPRILDLAQHA